MASRGVSAHCAPLDARWLHSGQKHLTQADMKPVSACVFILLIGQWCYVVTQREPGLLLSANSFRQIHRVKQQVPPGRSATLSDVVIRHYGRNSSRWYRVKDAKRLLTDPDFDPLRPTVLYAHGYVELVSDESVGRVVSAYKSLGTCGAEANCSECKQCAQCNGTDCQECTDCEACSQCTGAWNILVLDWANLGFGVYIAVALDLKPIGVLVGRALHTLIVGGLSIQGLHLVGHSMGAHLLAFAARELQSLGHTVPRLTGLDPAYPGFYPALLSTPMSANDADFVDAIHCDGGGYGAPAPTAHADFWPNGGVAKQPGCPSATILLTYEDFCSHWRSWELWAEAVEGGVFLARSCGSYDAFLRGTCPPGKEARMGPSAQSQLRGNFYLRTAARSPYALSDRGAN